jgi:hypothetical protein
MNQSDKTIVTTAQSSVRSTLNYTLDNGITPEVYFYKPPPGTVVNSPGNDPREVTIHNAWDRVNQVSVDREGFELKACPIAFNDFGDDAAIRGAFFKEVAEFVRVNVGARRVQVFDYNIRSKAVTELTTSAANPVRLVHSDYTPISGPQRVRDVLPDEADDLLKRRVAFFNLWKPIRRRVEELPLAVCDVASTVAADRLVMALRYPERTGQIYAMRYSPAHRWHYFPRMETNQALLLKCYDSEEDGRARFMPHSAFEDPTSPPDAPPRESIEVRTIAFF